MNSRFVPILLSLTLAGQFVLPAVAAADGKPALNFKIYSPQGGAEKPVVDDQAQSSGQGQSSEASPTTDSGSSSSTAQDTNAASASSETATSDPATSAETATSTTPAKDGDQGSTAQAETPVAAPETAENASGDKPSGKILQGYIRVVPSGTKIPIIMDTAVDTDTSQEGDEFAARTSEDLNIDGRTIVPAGSVIKGRIAQLNNPRTMGRSGSVALKFDTVTTPDNRQIPIVANIVARGGVVHARRGLKDIAMDTGAITIPAALGIGIGALAGSANSSSSSSSGSKIKSGQAALIGAGVGIGIGVAILLIKKGKKVDVRPGDELKIELAEDLRMPM